MFFKKKDASQEHSKIQASADKFFSQKKYQKALNEYLKLTKAMPDDIVLLNKIGDSYSKIQDNKNAFKYYERVANHHASTGFLPKAIAVYKKILKLDPEHTEARESLVKLYLQKGLESEAKAELKKIVDHYLESNLMTRALDTLRKLVELDPHNIQYHNQLAEILIKEGRSRDACQEFYQMALSFLDKKMVQQAKMVVQKALNLDPDHSDILIISARLSLEEGQFDKGASKLQKVLEKDPHNLEALKVLGQALFEKGNYDRAHQCFTKVLQIDSTETQPMEKLIEALVGDRHLDQAAAFLDPFADMLVSQKEHERATALVRNILEVDENHQAAIFTQVKIYNAVGNTSNAVLSLEKAANHFLNLDRPEKAAPFIDKILEIDPDNLEWKSQQIGSEAGHSAPREQLMELLTMDEDDSSVSDFNEEENLEEISALVSGDLDASLIEDTSTSIKNRLTEVEILVRHGLTDKAMVHLEKILSKFPDHLDANTQLRQIYLEQEMPEKAAECSLVLAQAHINSGRRDEAENMLEEAEPYHPGSVRKLRGLLEAEQNLENSLQLEEVSAEAYDPDLSSSGLNVSQENLIIAPSDDEVVKIKPGDPGIHDFEAPDIHKPPADDSVWALDIPAVGESDIEVTEDTFAKEEVVFDFMKDDEDSIPDAPDFNQVPSEALDAFDESATDPNLKPVLQSSEAIQLPEDDDDDEPIQIPMVDDDAIIDEADSPEDEDDVEIELIEDSDTELVQESSAPQLHNPEIADSVEDEIIDFIEDSVEEDSIENLVEDPAEDIEDEEALDLDVEIEDSGPPEPPQVTVEAPEILGELEEIDFFISMEAYQEAHNLVLEAIEKHGPLPELLRKQQEIPSEEDAALPPPIPESTPKSEEQTSDLFDLASVLSDELFDEEKEVTDNSAPEEFQSVEELFKEFKKGVAEQIAESDFQTHYDLGIGYKEMGLLKEGISEFQIAMGDPRRFLDCVTMISICQKEMGETGLAIETLQKALGDENLDESQRNTLRYELAITFEGDGELDEAIEMFQKIQESEPDFRDVRTRMEMLI